MLDFDFFRPRSLAEALEKLHEGGRTWRVIAGGTDLLLTLHDRHGKDPALEGVVDITALHELRGIRIVEDEVRLGPLTTFSDLMRSEAVRQTVPLLAEMASHMGSVQIRNRATLGGNLVNASPCADSAPPLLALEAEVELTSLRGVRRLPLERFMAGPGRTELRADEILTGICFSRTGEAVRWGYCKLGRRNTAAISRMTVVVLRTVNAPDGGTCRVAVGALTPAPVRLRGVESILGEEGWSAQSIERAAAQVRVEVGKITGVRWSSAYKLPVVENLARRTLESVL